MGGYTRPLRGPCSAYCGITHTHTHTCLTALCPWLPRWAGTRKVKPIWILLKQETVSGSGISWAVCKSAPHSRQTTTPAPHHSWRIGYNGHVLPEYLPIRYNTTIFTCWCVVFWRIFHQIDGACPWVVHLCVPLSGRGILWPTCSLETVNYSVGF